MKKGLSNLNLCAWEWENGDEFLNLDREGTQLTESLEVYVEVEYYIAPSEEFV